MSAEPEQLPVEAGAIDPIADPLPLAAPPERKSRAVVIVASSIVGLLLLCVVVYAFLAPLAIESFNSIFAGSELYGDVWWAAEGEYAVAQLYEEGVPYVVVWERSTGKTRRENGVRAVAVEPAGRVWLTPDDGSRYAGDDYYDTPDIAGDEADTPPERLSLWDLRTNGGPGDDFESRWAPLAGPGEYTAHLEVDALKGAYPHRLIFQPSSGGGEGIRADLPESVVTFEPIGWSPSGEYFALATLASVRPGTEDAPPGEGTVWTGEVQRLIVSADTGKVVSEETIDESTYSMGGARAVWDAEEDVLYFVKADAGRELGRTDDVDGPADRFYVAYLASDGREGEASALDGWKDPDVLESAWDATLLGPVAGGVVLQIETEAEPEIWSAGRSAERLKGVPEQESFGFAPMAYSAAGGLAVLEVENGRALYVVAPDGACERVWEAE